MEILQSPFAYNTEILSKTEPSILFSGVAVAIFIGVFIGMLILEKKLESLRLAKETRKKKEAIQDMILMKTLQGEMETEMKEALIREELRAKKTA